MKHLALILALSLPAAIAEAGVTTRMSPVAKTCQGAGQKFEDGTAKIASDLGGKNTRATWKKLVNLGAPGCKAVADWLVAGGAGGEPADWADAGKALVEGGTDDLVDAGASVLTRGDSKAAREVLGALEARLALLTPELAAALSKDGDKEVRDAALPVLIGYHTVIQIQFVMNVPVPKEVAYYGVTTAPEDFVVAATMEILTQGDDVTRTRFAKYVGRHLEEGYTGQDAWLPKLIELTIPASASEEAQEAANLATRALCHAEVAGIDDVLTKILASGNEKTLTYVVDGFERRLDGGKGSKSTIERLNKVAAAGTTKEFKRAGSVAKKFEKKVN